MKDQFKSFSQVKLDLLVEKQENQGQELDLVESLRELERTGKSFKVDFSEL